MEDIKALNLTPAESYFIQDPESKDGKTMMKYSLIHLIYKKMLSTEIIEEEKGIFKKKIKTTKSPLRPTPASSAG